jgi:NADH-quinone oxidoreductase subunit E
MSPETLQSTIDACPRERDRLIPLLQQVQEHEGYLSEEAVSLVARHLDLSEAEVYGVASFYTQFQFEKRGDHIIRVCEGTACHVKGGRRLLREIVNLLGIEPGQTREDGKFTLESVACFGSCALSPVMVVDGTVYGRMTVAKARKVLGDLDEKPLRD